MKNNNLLDAVQNPKALAIKRFMANLLGQKYKDCEEIVERITHYLVTEKDTISFSKMIIDAYESGYMNAVNDYKEQLNKIGVKVNISQKTLADNQKA